MNASEIMSYIKTVKGVREKINVQEIGKVMTAKGFRRKKIDGIAKYIVKKK